MNENKRNLMREFFKMNILMHRYQSYIFKTYGPFGNPHRGQGRILSLLKMKPEISQKELSYLLDMRNQSLGELLAKLERSGLIIRTPSESDRRVMNIKLTAEGEKIASESQWTHFDDNKLFNCLTDEEQANLEQYLKKIIEELKKELGEDGMLERGFGPWFESGQNRSEFARRMFEKMRGCHSFEECFDNDEDEPDEEPYKSN